jgi:hypothetical protein
MNQEIKAKWVAALRSGEYKQSVGYLKRDDGFCCLGVLSDVHAKEGGPQWEHAGSGIQEVERCGGYPPQVTLNWAEFAETSLVPGLLTREGDGEGLVSLNDSGEFTFSQIADVIEYFF